MKRSRLLILLLLLVLILAGGFYFLKSSKKKPAPKPKAPAPIAEPSPIPLEELEPPRLGVPLPGMRPLGTPSPELRAPMESPSPQRLPFPFGMMPPPMATPGPAKAPGDTIPMAESLPTETQPVIQINLPSPMKLAEGTTVILDPQVQYAGKARLQYQWKILAGSEEKIQIKNPADPKPRLTIDNLEAPTEFNLRLSVTDGKTEALADLAITAFPARLAVMEKSGGAWVGIEHMGDKWVAARGQELQIYDPQLEPLAKVSLDRPITQFFGVVNGSGKGAIYVQAPDGQWAVVQHDPAEGFKKVELPMLGRQIRRVVPFVLEGAPYAFALLERGVELWNLSDAKHPRLKTSQGSFLKNPLYLAFLQRNLYVAEENSIHLMDYSTGNLVATVPSGGSVTSLATYTFGPKNFLLASIGLDRTAAGRKDYGLLIYEIAENGRLGEAKRLILEGGVPVQRALVVPGPGLALLAVQSEKGPELRLVDLKSSKEIPLAPTSPMQFLALSNFAVGRIGENPVAVVTDGNQLSVLSFKPGATSYTVSPLKSYPALIFCGWVQASSDGVQLWVGDDGTKDGGALALVDGISLKVKQVKNAPKGTYPVEGDFHTGAPFGALLYAYEEPKALKVGEQEGRLALVARDAKDSLVVELSKPILGAAGPQGMVRPYSLAARGTETGLRIVVALARTAGSMGGAGLALLEKAAELSAQAFLESDLTKTSVLIPLKDSRDVVITQDGKGALVAAGTEGVVSVDLEKKTPVSRMSLGSEEWMADRILLGNKGDLVIASFLKPSSRQVLLKIFGLTPTLQMQEYGTITGISAVEMTQGYRAPVPAITEDDLYLFLPQGRVLAVFNLSDPGSPVKIAEVDTPGAIRQVAIANRFKDIFVALGAAGLARLEFGF